MGSLVWENVAPRTFSTRVESTLSGLRTLTTQLRMENFQETTSMEPTPSISTSTPRTAGWVSTIISHRPKTGGSTMTTLQVMSRLVQLQPEASEISM